MDKRDIAEANAILDHRAERLTVRTWVIVAAVNILLFVILSAF
jgi:hypothetical protein